MLIVLSAPSVNNTYYKDVHQQIIDFQVAYAKVVMGNDNIVVVADSATMPLLEGKLPADVLLEETIEDIWMRDFTTVIPSNPVHFKYRPSYFSKMSDAIVIQTEFEQLASRLGITYKHTDLKIDGGNIVDNNINAAITTERFLEDNNLTVAEGQKQLKELLGVTHVAIIPYDDDVMGHADGMVMFADEKTILVNSYTDDTAFRKKVIVGLKTTMPADYKIVEVRTQFDNSTWDVFSSACGVNLNSTVTHHHIYVPTFNTTIDEEAVASIESSTTKQVHLVPANGVCFMGGSVRCLAWQIQGNNAQKMITVARER